jgi:Fe2+ or Zn2+ uptake regulation protein
VTLTKYEACLERKKVNHSRAREAIYRIFLDHESTFMSVAMLHKKLDEYYPKKVSINTIYRHLNLFVSCDLVLLVQDDNKKAYYILVNSDAPVFNICPKCQAVGVEEVTKEQQEMLCEMVKPTKHQKAPFIVLHKICDRCM